MSADGILNRLILGVAFGLRYLRGKPFEPDPVNTGVGIGSRTSLQPFAS